ncbi:hypothetical protein SAMN05216357_1256 [Porphyromonadaceae bacterium KH3CP3RA]|nr:hypothetical protein SAMN05216357_1256 [Porphyromonadaceae bacterium KH3CP3RA]
MNINYVELRIYTIIPALLILFASCDQNELFSSPNKPLEGTVWKTTEVERLVEFQNQRPMK